VLRLLEELATVGPARHEERGQFLDGRDGLVEHPLGVLDVHHDALRADVQNVLHVDAERELRAVDLLLDEDFIEQQVGDGRVPEVPHLRVC